MQRPDASSNSPTIVLDASALLAFLLHEPGFDRVYAALLGGAAISTVNLAEVYTKTVASGRPVSTVVSRLQRLGLTVVPYTEEDARTAANLVVEIRPLSLSLGDRSCLATGKRLALPILTGGRVWANLQIGANIELFRS